MKAFAEALGCWPWYTFTPMVVYTIAQPHRDQESTVTVSGYHPERIDWRFGIATAQALCSLGYPSHHWATSPNHHITCSSTVVV
jgi:hypothetical protein